MPETQPTQSVEEAKPVKKELTLKQRKWLLEYMESGNATRAALKAYYPDFPSDKEYPDLDDEQKKTYNAASQIGWENMRKLNIEIVDLMDEAGLSDVYLVKKLAEQLEATRLYGKTAIEHMDGAARNKALEMALKMKNKLTDNVSVTNPDGSLKPASTAEIVATVQQIIALGKNDANSTSSPDDTSSSP